MVSPNACEIAERLVEQNIGLFRRQLTKEELLRFGGSCNKNEMRRKGLCFVCKGPLGPDHSCLGDAEEVTEVAREDIPSNFQGEDSSLDESMGSYEDASTEHESCGVVNNNNI